jgi:hypothetical protein
MAFLLELPSLAQVKLRIQKRKTQVSQHVRPVQGQALKQEVQISAPRRDLISITRVVYVGRQAFI